MVDAFDRLIREDIPISPDTFVDDNEKQTISNISSILSKLPGLQGYQATRRAEGADRVEILDPDNKVVLTIELDNGQGTSRAQEYIEALYGLSNNATLLEQKGAYSQGKKKKAISPVKNPTGTGGSNMG